MLHKLRQEKFEESSKDDFCFFVKLMADSAKYFEENLQAQDIPVALIGVGGVNWRIRTSGEYKVYVPYGHLDKAREIYNLLFDK